MVNKPLGNLLATINITQAKDSDANDWNNFCLSLSNPHHTYAFQWSSIIENTFSHKAHYLIAKSADEILGVLPLHHVKSMLFGNALISVPYTNGGGVLAKATEASEQLLLKAKELADELNVDFCELRSREKQEHSDLVCREHKVSMLLSLKNDTEEMFQTFPAKLRSQIRRPTKEGMTAKVSTVDEFYQVFCENMRDLEESF